MIDRRNKLLPWITGVCLVGVVLFLMLMYSLIDQAGYNAGLKDGKQLAFAKCSKMEPFERGWTGGVGD